MATFKYVALNIENAPIAGMEESPSRDAVLVLLHQRGLNPLLIEEIHLGWYARLNKAMKGGIQLNWSVSLDEMEMFLRIMAILLPAGVTVLEALELSIGETENQWFKKRLILVSEDIKGGLCFSGAIKKHPKAFPTLIVATVNAGENGGTLPECLFRLAEMYHLYATLRRDVISALTYPCFVFLFFNILIVGVVYATPKIISSFLEKDPGPFIHHFPRVMRMCYWVNQHPWFWLIPAAVIAAPIIMFAIGKKYKRSRIMLAKFVHRIPLLGKIIHFFALTRMINVFCMMQEAGVETGRTMAVISTASGHALIEDAIGRVSERVLRGSARPDAFASEKIFPKLFVELMRAGEKSGNVTKMLTQVGVYFYNVAKATTDRIVALMDPIIIIGMGLIVGPVLIALYQSLFIIRDLFKEGLM